MTLRLVSDRVPDRDGHVPAETVAAHLHALGGVWPGAAAARGSEDVVAGMGALYAGALLRDVPFALWDGAPQVSTALDALSALASGARDPAVLLRGRVAGAAIGPFVSQFLLVGGAVPDGGLDPRDGPDGPRAGRVAYGTQTLSQRGAGHLARFDHGTDWAGWQDVRDGTGRGQPRFERHARFVATPRDLASRVRLNAPFQAPLTACLLLMGAGTSRDAGLPAASDAHASFGRDHLLGLVTDAAVRALRAVREDAGEDADLSPQAVAAGIALAWSGDRDGALGAGAEDFARLSAALASGGLLDAVAAHNAYQNALWPERGVLGPLRPETNALLPAVHADGSRGAAAAVAAGACVTVLKACFEMFDTPGTVPAGPARELTEAEGTPARMWQACPEEPSDLRAIPGPPPTVQGELDKLAANLAAGCVFAGDAMPGAAHAALRRGERIAVRLLCEEVAAAGGSAAMRFTSFDGDGVSIQAGPGIDAAPVTIWNEAGPAGPDALRAWWTRRA